MKRMILSLEVMDLAEWLYSDVGFREGPDVSPLQYDIIREGIDKVRDANLLAKNHPILFEGRPNQVNFESQFFHKTEDKPDHIALGPDADVHAVVHEYGHYIDALLGRQLAGADLDREAWFSSAEFPNWMHMDSTTVQAEETYRETFADMFCSLVYKGTSAEGEIYSVAPEERQAFSDWFTATIRNGVEEL